MNGRHSHRRYLSPSLVPGVGRSPVGAPGIAVAFADFIHPQTHMHKTTLTHTLTDTCPQTHEHRSTHRRTHVSEHKHTNAQFANVSTPVPPSAGKSKNGASQARTQVSKNRTGKCSLLFPQRQPQPFAEVQTKPNRTTAAGNCACCDFAREQLTNHKESIQ